MASFSCHVFCVTKRIRLERIVRPPLPGTCARPATAQPLSETLQQLAVDWPLGRVSARCPRLELAATWGLASHPKPLSGEATRAADCDAWVRANRKFRR